MTRQSVLDLGGSAPQLPAGADRLQAWAPSEWDAAHDWQALLQTFWSGAAGQALGARIRQRLDAGACIYPPQPLRALALTPCSEVRVVILGQDPYHGPGQAEGLAFSVPLGAAIPPSLRNIRLELARDPALAPWTAPGHGSLQHWARQGVLLLNTCLTVEDGKPASHKDFGWEVLTDMIVRELARQSGPIVFLLWGAHAQKVGQRTGLEVGGRHAVYTANHPSPLSARRGPQPFLGCGHFSLARDFLRAQGRGDLAW